MRTSFKNALLLGVLTATLSTVACQPQAVTPKLANEPVSDSLSIQPMDDQPPKDGNNGGN